MTAETNMKMIAQMGKLYKKIAPAMDDRTDLTERQARKINGVLIRARHEIKDIIKEGK